MNTPKYSIVVPVFNGKDSLAELFEGIRDVMDREKESFEVVFVDDNSLDESWEVLTALKEKYPDQVTAVGFNKNFGQHNATFCGFSFARGKMIITIDDDLQTPPEEIEKLIKTYRETEADLVYGIYRHKKHSSVRNIQSHSLKRTSQMLHDSPGEGSSFRLIRSELVKKILHHDQNFIFLDEVFYWYTDSIEFTDVRHMPRKYKESGYSTGKLLGMAANLALYYTMIPLRLLVFGGLFISVVTFFYGIYFIIKKLAFNVPLGYTSLIVAILFSTSIILFSLGVIGEYLRRIYSVQNKKPPFSIRKVL
jgi:polyisoprenyl-phosphate glycosyltransferase